MHSLRRALLLNIATLPIIFLLLTPCIARERGPRVEVVCPSPPIPVPMGKTRVLVYELHITNFDTVRLTIKRIDIFGNDSSESLVSLADKKLSAALVRVGADMIMSSSSPGANHDTRMIDPGGRSVLFLWVELPSNYVVPTILNHRIFFSSTSPDATSPIDATLNDFQVTVHQAPVPTLGPPFKGGIWLVGDGPINDSNHRRSIFAIDGQIYSPERFAIDWEKIGENNDTRNGGSTRNENWWGWGEQILAVADGDITEAVDQFPDNVPRVLPSVTLDNIAGNHIILQISPNRFVTYAHLQRRSIRVRVGEHVHRGDVLALLGNSGNSTGAHLHLQLTDRNSVLQSQGVPFVFYKFSYLGPGSDYPEKQIVEPWTESIPPGNGVVKFEGATK
jgi:Peptidase family M23